MQKQTVFVDTNVLLSPTFKFEDYEKVFIAITSIEELDGLKKSEGILGYQARQAIRNIENANNADIRLNYSYSGTNRFLEHKNDNIILGFAFEVCKLNSECLFFTDDYNLLIKAIALGLPCSLFEKKDNEEDVYTGYKEIVLEDYELATFYEECMANKWDLLENQYLIIKNKNNETVDKLKWTKSKGFTPIIKKGFKSVMFGDTKPKDAYQECAVDSLYNSNFTMLFGYAGTAKTLLSLAYILQMLQNGKIDKCVIVYPAATLKNNASLGFYPGSRNEKILSTSLGGILVSKLGDMSMVETLINQGKLMLIPTADIRGIEISEHSCLYVTEAQNTDIYTMKTILQRAKDGCKIIIEGDVQEQTDLRNCQGKQNGMLRAIEVFKGTQYFSCVNLQNIYRSPVSEIAQKM